MSKVKTLFKLMAEPKAMRLMLLKYVGKNMSDER